jgi:predicted ribosome quality control (RQC) complex YloA/Tae2 family protein
VIFSARSKGFTYPQIWERIRDSGLPESEKILSLDHQGEMRVALEGQELELCAALTVPQNAQRYYEKAKELAKKQEGAKIALQATLQLGREKAGPQKTRQAVSARRRKPKWYERFRWFVSSEGLLVIGGRDSDSNEEIYSKYLEKRDLAFHTDAPGAPLTVIKTEGRDVQEATLQEAAQFAVSYSNLWKAGLGSADCYMVRAEQVTKTPEPGEFLRKGAFVIRGERRYFRDAPLGIALGIARGMLIGGPISAVRARVLEAEDDQDGEKNEEGFIVEIEPGEYNPDDLAKRIYRQMLDKFEDKRYLKAIASQDQIVQFLPPGGSRVKGQSG